MTSQSALNSSNFPAQTEIFKTALQQSFKGLETVHFIAAFAIVAQQFDRTHSKSRTNSASNTGRNSDLQPFTRIRELDRFLSSAK
jgi:hypothetical protein